MYDSEIYGESILDLIAKRREALEKLQTQVRKNDAVLENEYRKKFKGLPKPPVRRTKADRDADLSTFIPLNTSERIDKEKIQQEVVQKKVSKEVDDMVRKAQTKEKYEHLSRFRADVRPILGAKIHLAENHDNFSKFHVKLFREGNFTDERKDTSIRAFGWSELREIGLSYRGKDVSQDVKYFMKMIGKEWMRKELMEMELGLRTALTKPPSPGSKRKAT